MSIPATVEPVEVEKTEDSTDVAQVYSLKILVPGKTIGSVIGKGGASIKEITETSGANVVVRPRDDVGSTRTERVVDIDGTGDAIAAAYESIMFKVEAEAKTMNEDEEERDSSKTLVPLKILIANELIGHIIGKGGSTIKQLADDSGTEFQINQPESQPGPETLRTITVEGTAVGLCEAQKLVVQKLMSVKKSIDRDTSRSASSVLNSGSALYGASAFPVLGGRSERNVVQVLESMVGAVIGRNGVHAKEITKVSNAKIHIETRDEKEQRDIEEGNEAGSGPDERQIIVMGNPDCQFKAQQMIYERLVDEDKKNNNRKERRIKVHFPVHSSMLGRVIGKKGSKIKELSSTSGARLKLLRYEDEQEDDDTIVEIFGNFQQAQAAQNLIRQIAFEHRIRDISGDN